MVLKVTVVDVVDVAAAAGVLGDARRAGRLGDDWELIWKRREHIPSVIEPRLLNVIRMHLGNQVDALRPYPWQPKLNAFAKDGADLGIPARVFPQWLRCTGCDYLGPLPRFSYTNTHPSALTWRSSLTRAVRAAARSVAGRNLGVVRAPRCPRSIY